MKISLPSIKFLWSVLSVKHTMVCSILSKRTKLITTLSTSIVSCTPLKYRNLSQLVSSSRKWKNWIRGRLLDQKNKITISEKKLAFTSFVLKSIKKAKTDLSSVCLRSQRHRLQKIIDMKLLSPNLLKRHSMFTNQLKSNWYLMLAEEWAL